jgi:two-component system LytT family sensor kinase
LFDQHIVVLLVKLAVSAGLASILLRSDRFRRMLMGEDRTLPQRVKMAFGGALIYASGVAARVLTRNTYQAVDLGLEGSLLFGMMGGSVTGLLTGVLISIPAMLNGELLSMPLLGAVGVLGGLLRDVSPHDEAIWQITPFFDYTLYRLVRKRPDWRQAGFSLLCVGTILVCELLRNGMAGLFPSQMSFSLLESWNSPATIDFVAVYASTLFATILPLKIWNNNRNERKLETQIGSLNQARLEALTRQINPHFLFNTLNSVASLIRTNPEEARRVVYRLSHILRRLLKNTDGMSPLREELSFIDDYLAIEMVRFGDKLKFVKEIEPATLDRPVPSMLLQPIVENSIKHGLGSKIEGGTIRVRSRLADGRMHLVIEDDGVGIPDERLNLIFELGIGVSNVNERLKVLYGDDYRMWIDSKVGDGTRTGIEVPSL